jgi:hypothetical protein
MSLLRPWSFHNTTRIRAVVADGRLFDRAALHALLASTERAAATHVSSPP